MGVNRRFVASFQRGSLAGWSGAPISAAAETIRFSPSRAIVSEMYFRGRLDIVAGFSPSRCRNTAHLRRRPDGRVSRALRHRRDALSRNLLRWLGRGSGLQSLCAGRLLRLSQWLHEFDRFHAAGREPSGKRRLQRLHRAHRNITTGLAPIVNAKDVRVLAQVVLGAANSAQKRGVEHYQQ